MERSSPSIHIKRSSLKILKDFDEIHYCGSEVKLTKKNWSASSESNITSSLQKAETEIEQWFYKKLFIVQKWFMTYNVYPVIITIFIWNILKPIPWITILLQKLIVAHLVKKLFFQFSFLELENSLSLT